MQQNLFNDVANAARGHWPDLLSSFGIHVNTNGAHTACPVCGGKDRFRFDDKNGNGTWFCNQCDPQAGTGIQLVANVLGLSPLEAVKQIAPLVSVQEETRRPAKVTHTLDHRWRKARPANPGHGYLQKKGIGHHFAKQEGEALLIPMFNESGSLQSLQRIMPDGEKRFAPGHSTKGAFVRFRGVTDVILLCEGFATGATLYEETGFNVFVAFAANQLLSVAQYLEARFEGENKIFILCADADETGQQKADIVHQTLGWIVLTPVFEENENGTDWNDYVSNKGQWSANDEIDKCLKHELQMENMK